MTPDEAIAEGAMALFGEKYGEEVRVVSMGSERGKTYSLELCGGTHVRALGDIGLFTVVGEGAVSSGVRRVEALTGEAARAYLTMRDAKLREAATALKSSPTKCQPAWLHWSRIDGGWNGNLRMPRRRWRLAAVRGRQRPGRNRLAASRSLAKWSKGSTPRACVERSMR